MRIRSMFSLHGAMYTAVRQHAFGGKREGGFQFLECRSEKYLACAVLVTSLQ